MNIDNKKTEEQTTAETFVMYTALLWHWAWLLALCALLAGVVTYWQSRKLTPVFEATTTISIDVAPSSQTVTYTTLTTSEQLAATYAQEMTMQPMLDGVARRLHLAAFPHAASVQVTPIINTQLIKVVVQDTDPKRAALLANTLVQVFSEKIQADQSSRYADTKTSLLAQMATLDQNNQTATSAVTAMKRQIQETTNALNAVNEKIQLETTIAQNEANNKVLWGPTPTPQVYPETIDADKNTRDQLQITLVQYQSQLAQLQTTQSQYQQSYNNLFQSYQSILLAEAQSSSGVIQQNPAMPPDAPVKPKPVTNAILAAVIGLMIAAGGVFLIEFLDDTIRDPEEITRKWGVPVLGTIVSYPHEKDSLITAKQPRSPITEAFRSLRTNLQFASFGTPIHTLLVTSPSPEDGKTTVVANLGSVIAQGGRRVVLVDSDLRRPRLHKLLDVRNRDGLSNLFIQLQDHLDGFVKPTEIPGLHVLTSGNLPPNPSELLGSDRMSDILRQLTGQYDTVILDAPPMFVVTDALAMAPSVDGVLVVIKPSITKRASLKQLFEQLHQVNANVIGVVINDVKITRSRYYNYHMYYYSQKYAKGYGNIETAPEPSEKPNVAVIDKEAKRSGWLKKKTPGKKENNRDL
jgi:succinoglycan biosynthesis transport protein ExoP